MNNQASKWFDDNCSCAHCANKRNRHKATKWHWRVLFWMVNNWNVLIAFALGWVAATLFILLLIKT